MAARKGGSGLRGRAPGGYRGASSCGAGCDRVPPAPGRLPRRGSGRVRRQLAASGIRPCAVTREPPGPRRTLRPEEPGACRNPGEPGLRRGDRVSRRGDRHARSSAPAVRRRGRAAGRAGGQRVRRPEKVYSRSTVSIVTSSCIDASPWYITSLNRPPVKSRRRRSLRALA